MKRDELLRLDPQVDPELAESYLRYVEQLREAGIDVRPEYRLSPALGGLPSAKLSQDLPPFTGPRRNCPRWLPPSAP